MTFLKYSLLMSTALFLSVEVCWTMDKEEETVVHEFSKRVSYNEGNFQFNKEDSDIFTRPHKPTAEIPQSLLLYEDTSQPLPMEKVLMRIIEGEDGRIQIKQTTEWPYRIHGKLTMIFGGKKYGGSGVLIGPHHILTAGHNVYDYEKKEWASSIFVHLGFNKTVAPFGERNAVKVYTFSQWVKNKDKLYDMALLLLDDSIGHKIGWSGLLCLDDKGISKEKVTITGYPGDKEFKKMMTMSHQVKTIMPEGFYYDIDTGSGQSGSGIWINKWGSPYVVGVHAYGEGELYAGNSGVRLSSAKFEKIIEWISKTLYINGLEPNSTKTSVKDAPYSQKTAIQTMYPTSLKPLSKTSIKDFPSFEEWKNYLKTIDKPWVKIILEKFTNKNITSLATSYSHIGDEGAAIIAKILPHSNITSLDMAWSQMGDEGAKAIAAVLPYCKLESLNMDHNNIDDDGIKAIASVLPQSQIRRLSMNFNKIGDEGAKALAEALPQSLVTSFFIGYNPIESEGRLALDEARNIKMKKKPYSRL